MGAVIVHHTLSLSILPPQGEDSSLPAYGRESLPWETVFHYFLQCGPFPWAALAWILSTATLSQHCQQELRRAFSLVSIVYQLVVAACLQTRSMDRAMLDVLTLT